MDCEKGDGPELAKKYGIRGYPTYIVFAHDQSGKIDHWLGYDGPDAWADQVHEDMADPVIVGERLTRYEGNPTARDAAVLARVRAAESEFQEAVDYYRTAQKLDPPAAGTYLYPIFDATADGMRRKAFTRDDLVATADAVIGADAPDPRDVLLVALQMDGFLKQEKDPSLRYRYLKAAVRLTEGSDDKTVAKYRPELLVEYAMHIEKDSDKALSLKRTSMPDGWMEDSGELNSFAWWCFENDVNLAEAEKLARKGVELAEPGRGRASILDTVAEIVNARGDAAGAVELTKRAIAEAPEQEYFQNQLKRFEEIAATQEGGASAKM